MKDNVESNKDKISELVSSIPTWDPKTYFDNMLKQWNSFTAIISGSRMAGKSAMLKYLMHHPEVNLAKKFNLVVVFSKTIENGFYQSFIESKLMFKNFNPEVIHDLAKAHKEMKAKNKNFRFLIILDDFIDSRTKYNNDIADCFYLGRHIGCSIVCLTQKLSMLATGWFANTTLFICLFSGTRQEKDDWKVVLMVSMKDVNLVGKMDAN